MKKLIGTYSRLLGIAFLFTIISISSSCTKSSMNNMYGIPSGTVNNGNTGNPGKNEVWIKGMAFTPSTITVAAGTTITWTNKDGITHTVTSNTGVFDSGSVDTNGTFSFTFVTAGTYNYHCTIHPDMTGIVVVN